jgi:hypothetical protein
MWESYRSQRQSVIGGYSWINMRLIVVMTVRMHSSLVVAKLS